MTIEERCSCGATISVDDARGTVGLKTLEATLVKWRTEHTCRVKLGSEPAP